MELSQDPAHQLVQVLLSLLLILVAAGVFRMPNPIPTTRDGGLEALKQIQEWSKWMAGIQTAGFAALALLVLDKDGSTAREVDHWKRLFAIAGFVYLGAGLFCTAWVLSALPSHAIRLYQHVSSGERQEVFDIYEQPLFGWSDNVSLAYMLTIKHWLWAIGLLAIAAYCVALLLQPATKVSAPAASPVCSCQPSASPR